MKTNISLIAQTTYAELLERCVANAFADAFPEDGSFTSKAIGGRRYWYFQLPNAEGRRQRYAGVETPELLAQIEQHRQTKADERERRALVSSLVRAYGFPRPNFEIGEALRAMAKAGIFRLRGVLVGTTAYQTYGAMLGIRLAGSEVQTDDIDIAQFKNISLAMQDQTPQILDVLKEADRTFKPVPTIHRDRTTSYKSRDGLRVDFLTPNQGPDTDSPQPLPAFQTDAQPLRFLDFLISEPENAVLLHGGGVLVQVPAPQRYAVHKLIVSQQRREGTGKRDKDIHQAESLINVLAARRPYDLKNAWQEASERGSKWRTLLAEGKAQLSADPQAALSKAVE